MAIDGNESKMREFEINDLFVLNLNFKCFITRAGMYQIYVMQELVYINLVFYKLNQGKLHKLDIGEIYRIDSEVK